MKKIIVSVIILCFSLINTSAFGMSVKESTEEGLRDVRVQSEEPSNAPKWTDYVPEKYQNPRTDFSQGHSIAELSVGLVLTDLIVTSPIGVPMICHSVTKLKNISYAKKKKKFFEGLKLAETMTEEEQKSYYPALLKQCKMKKQRK